MTYNICSDTPHFHKLVPGWLNELGSWIT